jgi:hypothetical protein
VAVIGWGNQMRRIDDDLPIDKGKGVFVVMLGVIAASVTIRSAQ